MLFGVLQKVRPPTLLGRLVEDHPGASEHIELVEGVWEPLQDEDLVLCLVPLQVLIIHAVGPVGAVVLATATANIAIIMIVKNCTCCIALAATAR
eukprot:11901035-Alexandrium_andersonii.AAC.1